MLGEPLLRRHARIPAERMLVRFLVIAPERTELVRYKLERSPLLRAALEERRLATSSSGTTCARFLDAETAGPRRPGAAASGSIRSSSAAASRCRCSAADAGPIAQTYGA